MFRKNQFDEFLACVYQDGMPLMTVNSWRANQMDLVGLFMDRKEQDKLELAKKRSPAHDFQRQIKFDPKQCPNSIKNVSYLVGILLVSLFSLETIEAEFLVVVAAVHTKFAVVAVIKAWIYGVVRR